MGQLRKNQESIANTVFESYAPYLGIVMGSDEIIQWVQQHNLKDKTISGKLRNYLDRDTSHNNSDDIHTMNLLYVSLKDADSLNHLDVELMKILQGLEQQAILIDDVIDNPSASDKELKTALGFMLYKGLDLKFYDVLSKSSLSQTRIHKLYQEWNLMGANIYLGQAKDLINQEKNAITLDEYIQTVYHTTAAFTEYAMRLSAAIQNKSAEYINQSGEIGRELGIAFQIRDDYFDMEKDFKEGKTRVFSVKESPNYKGCYSATSIDMKIRQASSRQISAYVKNLNNLHVDNARLLAKKGSFNNHTREKLEFASKIITL